MTIQIAVRIPDDIAHAIDGAVDRGEFATRTEAVRVALEGLARRLRDDEIQAVIDGRADARDNVLKNAPHTAGAVTADEWAHPYTREQAAFPLPFVRANKHWPSVGRIDNPYGDRNLMCSCPPIEEYA